MVDMNGLNSRAKKIIGKAIKTGFITPKVIAQTIKKEKFKNQQELETIMGKLVDFLKNLGVTIIKEIPKPDRANTNSKKNPVPLVDIEKRNYIVEKNLGLAKLGANSCIRFLSRFRKDFSFDYEDLFQEGCMGLIRAAELYDEKLGFKFSTYAMNWVTSTIVRAATHKEAIIHIPEHVRDKLTAFSKLQQKNTSSEETINQIAELLGVSRFEAENLINLIEHKTISIDFDYKNSEAEDVSLKDTIADRSIIQPENILLAKEELRKTCDYISLVLEQLTEKERVIFVHRYGIHSFSQEYGISSGNPKSLDEVGDLFKVSRERIRQLIELTWNRIGKDKNIERQDFENSLIRLRLFQDVSGTIAIFSPDKVIFQKSLEE